MSDEQLPKKGMSGCLIALLVVGGICLIGAVGLGVGAYMFSQSDAGKQIVGAIGDMAEIMKKASTAPGTNEARALGCVTAMVFDGANLAKTMGKYGDAKKVEEIPKGLTLMCQVAATSVLTCDQLAKAYQGAPGIPADAITLVIQKQGEQEPVCEKQVGDAAAKARP